MREIYNVSELTLEDFRRDEDSEGEIIHISYNTARSLELIVDTTITPKMVNVLKKEEVIEFLLRIIDYPDADEDVQYLTISGIREEICKRSAKEPDYWDQGVLAKIIEHKKSLGIPGDNLTVGGIF